MDVLICSGNGKEGWKDWRLWSSDLSSGVECYEWNAEWLKLNTGGKKAITFKALHYHQPTYLYQLLNS